MFDGVWQGIFPKQSEWVDTFVNIRELETSDNKGNIRNIGIPGYFTMGSARK